ncbi:PepSY-associated TM helix domain-containing protein [Pseudomonas schmalbachii]|uniref:PepSY domain-containing protein n=1 Tax=Pseudomonas schmalbachii TaxID=2816993 RepID=A0ABS3TWN6_9PSED|nr:PepSY-associated TM helix domain-containing protein [Pseudomonas schmalbachii]MBO3278092.1 PepSY domain-containing protein [Pseudomonas schmalbachii]
MAKSRMFSPQTIKRFTSVHSWIGIATGMALFIAFYAGAITMYAEALHQWANPELRQSSGTLAQLDRLVSVVATERASGGNFSISLGDGEKPSASYFEGNDRSRPQQTRVLDEQFEVVPRQTHSEIRHFINQIHFTLGLPFTAGFLLMGVVSLVYFLALVTGVLIHLPHLLADLYALRVGRNLKRLWLDAHNVVGVLSLPFHLMFAFTGFLFSAFLVMPGLMQTLTPTPAPSKAYLAEGRFGESKFGGSGADKAPGTVVAMLPASRLIAIASARVDGFQPTGISYTAYGTEKASAKVTGHLRTELIAQGWVIVSPITGEILKVDAPGERSTGLVLENSYLSLHVGEFGGELMRALYFLLGLAGAFLFFSGNLLWIESRRRHRQPAQPGSGWVMAQVTLGVCLGCCLGIGFALLGNRLLVAGVVTQQPLEANMYFIGFFGALMWSLARPPSRAGVELLSGCAVVYAVLPILNAMLTRENLLVTIREQLWGVAVIDLMLAGLAVSFGLAGRAAWRRARFGPPNSVWSLASPRRMG